MMLRSVDDERPIRTSYTQQSTASGTRKECWMPKISIGSLDFAIQVFEEHIQDTYFVFAILGQISSKDSRFLCGGGELN
jgi:hypothetical protein